MAHRPQHGQIVVGVAVAKAPLPEVVPPGKELVDAGHLAFAKTQGAAGLAGQHPLLLVELYGDAVIHSQHLCHGGHQMLAGGGDEHQLVAPLPMPFDARQPLGVEPLAQHLLGKTATERVEPLARLAHQRLQGEGHVLMHVHLALMVEGHHPLLLGHHARRGKLLGHHVLQPEAGGIPGNQGLVQIKQCQCHEGSLR